MSLASVKSLLGQLYPPKPQFTEKDVPDLKGKVCIVTGSNTGVGKEIAQILYAKNAKVYLAARSEDKTHKAIDSIRAAESRSTGDMEFLRLDLADLTTIPKSVQEFHSKERELHLLFNNAGVAYPEPGSTTAQSHDLTLGVNCLGPFLFTKLLTPTLASTAKAERPGSVRVVWSSSSALDALVANEKFMGYMEEQKGKSISQMYFASKIINYFYGTEMAARHRADGILSLSVNPGNLDSDLWRTQGPLAYWFLKKFMLYPVINGAYTNLFAALSPGITMDNGGLFVVAWGRPWKVTADKANGAKAKSEGGTGIAQRVWEWSERQVKPWAT